MEWSPDAPSDNQVLTFVIKSLLPSNDHRLVLSIHSQSHNIVPWHSRQLLGNDILEVNQVSHRLKFPKPMLSLPKYLLVVLNHYELNLPLILLLLDLGISFQVTLVWLQ